MERKQHTVQNGVEGKVCSKCLKWRPLQEYNNTKNTWDGKVGQCKQCKRDLNAARYVRQYEQLRQQALDYAQSNQGQDTQALYRESARGKQNAKISREKHKSIQNARARAKWHNREDKQRILHKYRVFGKAYRSTSAGRQAAIRCTARRRQTDKQADLTSAQWEACQKFFNYTCAYCGAYASLAQEHVLAASRGGKLTLTNIVPACKSCNSSKGVRDMKTWFKAQKFYSEERIQQIETWLTQMTSYGTL